VTDSVLPPGTPLRFVPLTPAQTVPLVLVWQEDHDTPPVRRFRELLVDWKAGQQLWGVPSAG
jgi:DNA-binding transcriptional LysR family regulator